MTSNDIIIRVQFAKLTFFATEEDTNYLMSRGCVCSSHSSAAPRSVSKIAGIFFKQPSSHKFTRDDFEIRGDF